MGMQSDLLASRLHLRPCGFSEACLMYQRCKIGSGWVSECLVVKRVSSTPRRATRSPRAGM